VITGNGFNTRLGIDEPWRAVLPLPNRQASSNGVSLSHGIRKEEVARHGMTLVELLSLPFNLGCPVCYGPSVLCGVSL
jgi:hypothetical protein